MLGLVNRIDLMKKQRGIGLLELMLALAIIAVLLIMATRYYQSTSQSQKMGQVTADVNAIVAAAETQRAADPSATYDIETLITNGYLPRAWGDGTKANPWGGAYTAAPGTTNSSEVSVTASGIPDSTCAALEPQMKRDALTATCSGGTLTATYGAGSVAP